jgi:hypothetical protein
MNGIGLSADVRPAREGDCSLVCRTHHAAVIPGREANPESMGFAEYR